MSKGIGCAVVVVLVLVVLGLALAGTYNNLVGLSQAVDAQWAQVESVYQRRADLIPNLVSTVQGAANFEKETYIAVAEARARVGQISGEALKNAVNDPQAFQKFQEAQAGLSSALSRLLAVSESYPDLKASQNFRDLQAQLEGTENRIAVERRRFNEAVREYNTRLRLFPGSIVARLAGFQPKAFFEATPDAATPPKVKF